HAVLGGRLVLAGQRVTDRLHHRSRSRDEREERRQLLIAEIEALKPRERGERLEAERFHARRIAGHAFIDKREPATIMRDMSERQAEVVHWLRGFEAACRERDFASGRALFAEDAVAFGTWATRVMGLGNIEHEQWRNVWPRIREFRFEEHPVASVTG